MRSGPAFSMRYRFDNRALTRILVDLAGSSMSYMEVVWSLLRNTARLASPVCEYKLQRSFMIPVDGGDEEHTVDIHRSRISIGASHADIDSISS